LCLIPSFCFYFEAENSKRKTSNIGLFRAVDVIKYFLKKKEHK
jgi:hypothetical protein